MPVWDEALTIRLPYTNAGACYDRLKQWPEVDSAFHGTLVPLAEEGGSLSERVEKIEAARERALKDYLDSGRSLREVDVTLNCCVADLYMGLFSTAADKIRASALSTQDKVAAITTLREAASHSMSWNPTKKIELDMTLDGTAAEIESEE